MKTEDYHKQLMVLKLVYDRLDSNVSYDKDTNKPILLKYSLHYLLTHAINDVYNVVIIDRFIHDYIPLFNKENAIKYGNANPNIVYTTTYWWTTDLSEGAIDIRKKFIKWIIDEITFEYKHPILYWIKTNVFNKRVYHK